MANESAPARSGPRWVFVKGTSQYRAYKWLGFAIVALLVFLVAFAYNDTAGITLLDNEYKLGLTRIMKGLAFAIAILGLQVVVGFTGQLSLGQGFFFGLGAYIAAYLVQDRPLFGWNYWTALIVVIPVCFIVGMAFGLPALRIKGLYLALVTLGLAAIFPALIQLEAVSEYTNGAGGKLVDYDFAAPEWLPLDGIAGFLQGIPLVGQYFGDGDLSSKEESRIWLFFLIVIVTAICVKLIGNLIQSRPGRALRAVRDNETSAAVSGINLAFYKTMSFGVASALGGVGGVIYVAELGIAAPLDFTQLISIFFIVGLVVGGVGTLSGAIIGGLIIAFLPDWASSTQNLPGIPERWLQGPTGPLVMGILLIALTFLLPGGIIAGVRQLRGNFVQVVPEPPEKMKEELAQLAAAQSAAPAGAADHTEQPDRDDDAADETGVTASSVEGGDSSST